MKRTETGSGLVKIGMMPELRGQIAQLKEPSKAQERFLDRVVEIRTNPGAHEHAFIARELVQCTLPHRDPGDTPRWTRTNGSLKLGITPGWDFQKDCSLGFPYGSYPRLLLFWITTQAVQTASRKLELDSTYSRFLQRLGLGGTSGGTRGELTRFRNQARRLFGARISFHQQLERHGATGQRWLDMQVAPQGELWWDPKDPDQIGLWGSYIVLGEHFFEAITASPVPVDHRHLRALKQSPLALDLYAWATHKVDYVLRKNNAQFVPWTALLAQFGGDYVRVRKFREKAIFALSKIKQVYVDLQLDVTADGITVLASSKRAIPLKPILTA